MTEQARVVIASVCDVYEGARTVCQGRDKVSINNLYSLLVQTCTSVITSLLHVMVTLMSSVCDMPAQCHSHIIINAPAAATITAKDLIHLKVK